jgi:hypothetical protein
MLYKIKNQSTEVVLFEGDYPDLIAELQEACSNHFDADPDNIYWGHSEMLKDYNAKLQDMADCFAKRGEYAA